MEKNNQAGHFDDLSLSMQQDILNFWDRYEQQIEDKAEQRQNLAHKYRRINLNRPWHTDKFDEFWGQTSHWKTCLIRAKEDFREVQHQQTRFLVENEIKTQYHFDYISGTDYGSEDKNTGRRIVSDFYSARPDKVLDLTWLRAKDGFKLRDNRQYRNLKTIIVNLDNLIDSTLPTYSASYYNNLKMDLAIVVNGKHSRLDPNKQIQVVQDFFKFAANDEHHINTVVLTDFHSKLETSLNKYLQCRGFTVGKKQNLTVKTNRKALKNVNTTMTTDLVL